MGRTPCCDKIGLKKGPWTPGEDFKLISFIAKHGHDNWRALPKQAGLLRCGKSCRLRWTNYLRPDIKRGNFTPEEEETIMKLHGSLGNKWSKIASHLPGRTDNEIKNVWHTHLKKRLVPKEPKFSKNETNVSSISTASSTSSSSVPYGNNELQEGVGGQVHQQSDPINGFPKVNEMGIEEINKQDFLVEPVQNEVQPSIWDMLDGNGYNVKDNVGNRVLGKHMVSKQRGILEEEHKEFSSCSSYKNYSNSHVPYSNQTEGSRQEEQEVNKKDPVQEVIEIPFDPNLDVWNILDSSSSPFNEASIDEVEAQQHSTSGEQEEENRDSARWIRYLETELGLHLTYDEMKEIESDDTAEPLSPDLFIDGALAIDGIIDPVETYFKLQPTSTNYFGV